MTDQNPPGTHLFGIGAGLRLLLALAVAFIGLESWAHDCSRFASPQPTLHKAALEALGISWDEAEVAIRDLGKSELDIPGIEIYLKNYKDSVEHVFLPAYLDGSIAEKYEEIMRRQHVVLTRGLSGDVCYDGNCALVDRKRNSYPGVFSFDQSYMMSLAHNTGGLASPGAQMDFHRYVTISVINADTVRFSLDFLKGRERSYYVDVSGIPDADTPTNMAWGTSNLRPDLPDYTHTYPAMPFFSSDIGRRGYFKRANALMIELVKEKDARKKLDLLATYYHVALNGHIFVAGNQSLLMGQVNAILETLGYHSLRHEILDYKANMMDDREFVAHFLSLLKKKS